MADGEIIVDIEVGTDKAEKQLNNFIDRARKSLKNIEVIDIKVKINSIDTSSATKKLKEFKDSIKPIKLKFDIADSITQKYNDIISKLKEYTELEKEKANGASDSSKKQKEAQDELAKSLSVVNNRIFNLLKSAFIFNVISKGFRLISNEVGLLINRDSILSQSLLIIRANLINAFTPIIRVILPWVRALGDWLVWLSQKVVGFVNLITGGNAKVVSSASEAQSTIDDYNVTLGKMENIQEPDVFQGISDDATKAGSAIGTVADKTSSAVGAIRKLASRLPKVSDNVKKLRDKLAPFDKINLLKSKKNGYYDLVHALSPEGLMGNVSNKLPSYRAGKIGGIKSGRIKGPKGGGISGKMPKLDKLALPKIEFDVDPNSLALLEKLKNWLDKNSDAAKLLKASFVALAVYLGSRAFIDALNNIFGLSLAGKWAGPLALGVGAGYFLYNFFKGVFKDINKALEEGEQVAQKRLKDHPEWIGKHIDEKGYRLGGYLPGEDRSEWLDTDTAYIMNLEEKGKEIASKGGWMATMKENFIDLSDKSDKFFLNILKGINEVSKNVNTTTVKDLDNVDDKTFTVHTRITDLFKMTGKQIEITNKKINDWVSSSWENLKSTVIDIWNKSKDFFGDLIKKIEEANKKLGDWISTGWENLKISINDCWSKVGTFFSNFGTSIDESWRKFEKWVNDMWNKFSDFSSNIGNKLGDSLNQAWENIKKWFKDVGKAITDNFTNFFSGNPNVSNVEIPHLAQGAVLRGGDPFLSYINDQPRGQTNIETPLSTMVEAFKIAMSEGQPRTPNIVLNATGNMAQFIRLLNIQLSEEDARVGTSMVSFGG